MKVIIAGSRRVADYRLVEWAMGMAMAHGLIVTEVVSGKEPNGVDHLGERWAEVRGIPVRPFPADWTGLGPRAGPVRNEDMAAYAEALVALPGPESRGTRDMIRRAARHRLWVLQFEVEGLGIRCWWKEPVTVEGAAPYL